MRSSAYHPSPEARREELRRTVISCITQKLQRLDIDRLRDVLAFTTEALERQKQG